jgi:hypothetical protein
MIFSNVDKELKNQYINFGFIQFRPDSLNFKKILLKCYQYYSIDFNSNKYEFAFKNSEGIARHIIDVFRDNLSPAIELYRQEEVIKIINLLSNGEKIGYFTHSKLSFKEPYKITNWYPHQDNGYKAKENKRQGFAIFICLESMNEENGCLQVLPQSHLLGTLEHERIVEDKNTGDNQLCIKEYIINIKPVSIIAEAGDIIVFHNDMIHMSGNSSCNSKRLALIAEVEFGNKLRIDDYGLPSIYAKGGESNSLRFIPLEIISYFQPLRWWRFIKKYFPILARFIRKIK